MNNKRGILGPLVLAFGLCAGVFLATTLPITQGCTTSQKRIVYETLYSTHVAVDGTFSGYMAAVLTGSAPTNNVPRAAKAYRDFQTVFGTALRAAQFNTNAPATADVISAAAAVTAETAH